MPKGQKRKREEEDNPDPLRRSSRQRKRVSFGEDFLETWSPPKGTPDPTPRPSTSTTMTTDDPEPMGQTVTWPSDPEHWAAVLPPNHRKHLAFSR